LQSQTYANLALLYDHLLRTMLLGQLPTDNIPTDTSQTQYFSDRLEEITQPWQLVNFTANRLKSFQQQYWNKYSQLNQEMQQVFSEAETTAYELAGLKQQILTLADQGRALGMEIHLDELAEPTGTSTAGGFNTKFAAVLLAPLAIEGGEVALALAATVGRAALTRAVNYLLANPAQVTALASGAAEILNVALQNRNVAQRQAGELTHKLAKPNLSAELRGLSGTTGAPK
jgi:hypothetical protein